MPRADRLGAVLGAVAIAGNLLGVVFLAEVPGAYRPAQLDGWTAGTLAHPGDTARSAAAFVVGLVALAGWAAALGRWARAPLARAGAAAIAAGALVNAAGCVAPAVLALHVAPACGPAGCVAVARALLGTTLALDALFNLLLGAGLLAVGAALLAARARPVLGALAVAAGLGALPVALQVVSEDAARWLAVAAPLWLGFIAASAVALWGRAGARRRVPQGGGAPCRP